MSLERESNCWPVATARLSILDDRMANIFSDLLSLASNLGDVISLTAVAICSRSVAVRDIL